jgi:hypothetical protein
MDNENEDKLFFWIDSKEDYIAEGGYFVRNELKDFFKKLKEQGKVPVGIMVDMNSYNMEIIVKIQE